VAAKKRRWGRIVLRVLLVILVAALVATGIAWSQAASLMADDLVDPRNDDLELPPVYPEMVDERFRVPVGDFRGQPVELDVWLLYPRAPHPERGVDLAVVLHGVADHKRTMMPLARRFSLSGLPTILVDLRGHGESTVTPITYGVRDREDLSAVLDHVRDRYELGVDEVGVYGPSYGGAVAMQWAAHDERVKRCFSVSSFASMHRIVRPYIRNTWDFMSWAIPESWSDEIVDGAGERAGFDPSQASPIDLIPNTHARHILVHSRDDEIVPYQHAVDTVAACGERCRLVTLEGRTHLQSMSNTPLRLESYQLIVGEEFPGDQVLVERWEASGREVLR